MAERAQVHYEVFARRRPTSSWALEFANEDRQRALDAADLMLREREAVSVKVHKETLDAETRQYRTSVILEKGAAVMKATVRADAPRAEPPCLEPADLYTAHARDRIGRLMEGWLARKAVTPFELLHRPDLAELLDAAGLELQAAMQKIAVPEAQGTGANVHEVIRAYQRLTERAIARVVRDGRRGAFPDFAGEPFAAACARLADAPDRGYRLGGGVARALAGAPDWAAKIDRLLDLAAAAPLAEPLRAQALAVLETPLAEALEARAGLADLLGADTDLGAALAALTRMSAHAAVEAMLAREPALRGRFPTLGGPAARLATWLDRGDFAGVRAALSKRVLAELTSPRRLRPTDPDGEIEVLRALARALTAAATTREGLEAISQAFVERSRRLVAADFVQDLLARRGSAMDEARALIHLAENVAGGANKRAVSRWLFACVSALRFETELRGSPDTPNGRLEALAALQQGAIKTGLTDPDGQGAIRRIGEVGGWVEADAGLIAAVGRAPAPVARRLALLLKFGSGETAPTGPAAERARVEAHKLLRQDDVRAELGRDPEALAKVRAMIDGASALAA